jgi:phage terminase large subunit-like protein
MLGISRHLVDEMQLREEEQAREAMSAAERVAQEREAQLKNEARDALGLVDPDPVRWAQRHFFVPELRGPVVLHPYQKLAMREALAVDFLPNNEDGSLGDWQYRYSTIVWSDIKKSIKSTIAAAICLWKAFQQDWSTIYTVANDLKQADSRVGYYIRRAIELNPILRDYCKIRNYKISLPNHSTIESIPLDPTGEAGSNADMIVFSELWGATSKTAERMWVEMTLSPTKFGKSFRWVETYAGYTDSSTLLRGLYESAVLNGTRLHDDVEIYADKPARLFAMWNTRPRLSWQTTEYYAQEQAVMASMPEEFNRVHRNEWLEGSRSRFIENIALWDQCASISLPDVTSRTPMVLAADAAISGDTFGLVGLTRHPRLVDGVVISLVRLWDPKTAEDKYIVISPKGMRQLNFSAIEEDIRDICKNFNVLACGYDPYQLHHMMTRLDLDNSVRTIAITQGAPRMIADKALLDAILTRKVTFNPKNSEVSLVRQHVDNADRQTDKKGNLRMVKRSDKLKIDLAVCASMANYLETELPQYPMASEDDGNTWGQQTFI